MPKSKRARKEAALVSGMAMAAERELLRRRRMTRRERIAEDAALGKRPAARIEYAKTKPSAARPVRRSPEYGRRLAEALAKKVAKAKGIKPKEGTDGGA